MAFTGTATFAMITNSICRITGLSLLHGASGTISLAAGTGDKKMPASFQAGAGEGPIAGTNFTMADAIECTVHNTGAGATNPVIAITKSGTVPADFLLTLANQDGANDGTALEIYVKFHT